ncbi:MAG: GSU2403 family nucleotidyltransferase fold protein [Hyphomicrobiaceae bacterium]
MFKELDGDQIRVQTNATQTFEGWREVNHVFRHSYQGRMNWSRVNETQYLYRINGTVRKSLGPRSPETERIKEEYVGQRKKLRDRRNRLWAKLKELAPINRAYRLGRIPKIAADILRALDNQQLMGDHLIVVGTHSLYAYEAAAGIHIDGNLIATTDIDLLWDVRRRLRLALLDAPEAGVLGVLKKVDKSFDKTRNAFRARNDDGYLVDLIRPMQQHEFSTQIRGVGGESDLEATAITGLQWLMNAPRFNQIAIGDDGYPAFISCVDPRAFALYKRWLAEDAKGRDAAKRRRDRQQAIAVAKIAQNNLGLRFSAKDLTALPLRLTLHAKKLAASASR